jgi:hypothetical protein
MKTALRAFADLTYSKFMSTMSNSTAAVSKRGRKEKSNALSIFRRSASFGHLVGR